ncbi:MAG: SpoIIE family protein phosphatase [Marinoscillum sp.]|uniref:SpoIIE family protein phosphatase n=1 Tax=Marinoscillum sp. TaxID=2024838 RepID=UPI0032F32AB0
MNIYAKLTLLCVSLVFFTSSVLYFFVNRELERTFSEELLSNVTRQSEQTISNIERFVYSRLNELKIASTDPYFRQSNIPQADLTRKLQELESLNDLYASFSFFNNERVRIADSKQLSVGETHSLSTYWTKISPTTDAVVDVDKSESTDLNVMNFATVVKDPETREPKGVLVGSILVDELYKFMGDISLGENARQLSVTLLDEGGIILYTQDESKTVLQDKFSDFDLIQKTKKTSARVERIETDDQFLFVAKEQGYLNNVGNDWTLVVSIGKEEALLPLAEIQQKLLWVILLALGASIILALIVANIFVRPIVKLSKIAEDLGNGNLSAEIKITSNDEVGKLASQLSNASQVLIRRLDEQKKLNDKLENQKNEMVAQKQLLEQANRQVSDSIVYAQRIQRSILPEITVLSKLVKDAFVFYEPKDVVSGDFYWFERVRQGRNEYLIIACADCTGHGVPGAIMSIMGSNQLTNIVYYQNYIDPNKILARLDKVIKFELKRDENQNQDGLEIGICIINLDDLKMEFAGAGIPLYLIKKGTNELITYKSPKFMIGGIEGDEKEVAGKLNKEEMQLEEGDKIYLSSDGFQDQFGGEHDKKFLSKNFKKLIEDISDKPMSEQIKDLESAFRSWKKNTPQTDDVVVIGVEV